MTFTELFHEYPALLIAGCFLLGAIVGSFLNVVIYRLPKMMERAWRAESQAILELEVAATPENAAPFNLAFPNSHCPNCNAAIQPWQNIPVVSYLLLKGRCGNCRTAISARYPIIEICAGLLAALAASQLGFSWQLLAALVLLWTLLTLTMIDVDHQLLPDQLTLPLLWLGLLLNLQNLFVPLHDAVLGAAAGYLILWGVFHLFRLITGKEGMGYGDFKLLAALGAWMGWQMLPIIILLSSLVGAVAGSILLVVQRKGRSTPIPFGPYLAGAGAIAFFWGKTLIENYLQFAGL
ncbi:MAG TPA: A24 family peptidase [Spongiibacteraceae bacterium]|nr:A24 family peptidase [Spongiibacteraceae bacterium]